MKTYIKQTLEYLDTRIKEDLSYIALLFDVEKEINNNIQVQDQLRYLVASVVKNTKKRQEMTYGKSNLCA